MRMKQALGMGLLSDMASWATGAASPPPVQFFWAAAFLSTHETVTFAPQAVADLANRIHELKAISSLQSTVSPGAYLCMIPCSCWRPGLFEASSKGQFWMA